MSLPFAHLVGRRADQLTDAELTEEAFSRLDRWSLMSSDKRVSLDEVAWLGALMLKALKASGIDIQKHETRDENGARVVGVVASDCAKVVDSAL